MFIPMEGKKYISSRKKANPVCVEMAFPDINRPPTMSGHFGLYLGVAVIAGTTVCVLAPDYYTL